jgi:arylsulfatase A-like enzyme
VVLLTVEGLRADGLGIERGGQKLTPRLDELARRATWSGEGIANSSLGGPSLASLLTGLGPWKHGVLRPRDVLAPPVCTLAETLHGLGYETAGFHRSATAKDPSGLAQGLDRWERLRGEAMENPRLAQAVAALGPRKLLWIHLDATGAAYRRRDAFLDRLVERDLPRQLGKGKLQRSADAQALSEADLRAVRALYETNLAALDQELGGVLAALERSPAQAETVLVLAGVRGEALGENGDFGAGRSLERGLIEVPLMLKLGAGAASRRIAAKNHPSLARLYATLVELAGGRPTPGVAPSLFRAAPEGVLSELYRERSANHFSWLREDTQLVWQTPLARFPSNPVPTRAERRRRRQLMTQAFLAQKPLHGERRPVLSLQRWDGPQAVFEVRDPALTTRMAAELEAAFRVFLGEERSLEREGFERR